MKFQKKKLEVEINKLLMNTKDTDNYGPIFSYDEVGKYSNKIKSICDNIIDSDGIVLIYSEL